MRRVFLRDSTRRGWMRLMEAGPVWDALGWGCRRGDRRARRRRLGFAAVVVKHGVEIHLFDALVGTEAGRRRKEKGNGNSEIQGCDSGRLAVDGPS